MSGDSSSPIMSGDSSSHNLMSGDSSSPIINLCYCDPSYYIPPAYECSVPYYNACLSYNIFTVLIFCLGFIFVVYEIVTQLFWKRKIIGFKYAKRLKLFGYIALAFACIARAVRYGMAAAFYTDTTPLNSLYFLALILIFTAYTFLISVWIHVLLIATNKPAIYLTFLKVFGITVNIVPYTVLLVGLNVDPDFWFVKANAIAFALIFCIGAAYGYFGKRIEVIALESEAIAGKSGKEHAIRKVTRQTMWISIVYSAFGVVTVTAAGISYAFDNVPFFLTRHFTYRLFEFSIVCLLTIVLRSRSENKRLTTHVSMHTISEPKV